MGQYIAFILEEKINNEWKCIHQEDIQITGMYIPGFLDAFGTHILKRDKKSAEFEEMISGSNYGYGILYCTEEDIDTCIEDLYSIGEDEGQLSDNYVDCDKLLKILTILTKIKNDQCKSNLNRIAWIHW